MVISSTNGGSVKITKIATTASDCFSICFDNEDDIMQVKLMKTMMCEVAATHYYMLTDYVGSLPLPW